MEEGNLAVALEDDFEVTTTVEDYLNEISYDVDPTYVPSDFALRFITFIKLVNGEEGEENKSPVIHMEMLDKAVNGGPNVANMCARGLAKTTLLAEYLFLYIACFGELDNFGTVNLALYVSDSVENGVKNMRKNLEFRWENSEFLQKYIPRTKFTEVRWEFINVEGHTFIVKGYGAKALALDSFLYQQDGVTTIKDCKIGDQIYGPDGKLTTIIQKSEVFHKPMYKLTLVDGRFIKVSEDHINSVVINTNPNNTVRLENFDLTTKELLKQSFIHTKIGNKKHKGVSSKHLVFIKNTAPIQYPKRNFSIDPYTLGVILGDGRIQKPSCSVELTTHLDDLPTYHQNIPYKFGKGRIDKRNPNTWTQSIRGLGPSLKSLQLGVHGRDKFIPEEYFYGSVVQRLDLLQGLMDTDGTVDKKGRTSFCSTSPQLLADVMMLVRSLGGTAKTNKKPYNCEIWLNKPLFKLERKLNRQRYDRKDQLVAVESLERIEDEASQCIAVDNADRQFLTTNYFRTHNTGVRGTKELGVRPQLAVMDDLISDEDARSATVIASIEDTIYKAVNFALHPKNHKIIWSGTPFNTRDPLYKAVESGAWAVNVYPICEEFPVEKSEFKGAWEDRFPYEYVEAQYIKARKTGKIENFNQELMLRIMSDEDRMIADNEIVWYNRDKVLTNKGAYNFYITTDFATSEKTAADFSVISVWAYNNNGDWLWVDGVCKKQLMDKNINDLFRLAQMYNPQSVGIEISGQQKGFISWIQGEMLSRNCYFTLAQEKNSSELGLRPATNKIQRFNVVLPLFKLHKVWFPKEMQDGDCMKEAINELKLISKDKIKSKHDDFLDTIAMLGVLTAWKPSQVTPSPGANDKYWSDWESPEENETLESYLP